MKKIAFTTLGCRLNQYETDALVTSFKDAGYQVVPWQENADAYVINTCTVTDRSDRKSRALINQAGRSEVPATTEDGLEPVVVVTGCYADKEGARLAENDSVTYVVDNDRKSQIFHIVDAHFRGEVTNPIELPADRFSYGDPGMGFHTRSTLKIQDGCDNFCTFCIIPHVRGGAMSRPANDVVDQARRMIDTGAKEIVITGVNIGRYDAEGTTFAALTERILELEGDFRIRISSIEPDSWGEDFVRLLDHPKLCPHLHLCLQSGSDRILLAMRRLYTVSDYLSFVDRVRAAQPDFNITTDVMVGFPGETEHEFEETGGVVKHVGFSHIHTFPYSVREGTRAARMSGQVPKREKTRRAGIIRDMSDSYKLEYRRGLLGRHQHVLVEQIESGIARGYGEHYVPVQIPVSSGLKPNTFVPVRLERLADGDDPVFHGAEVPHDSDSSGTKESFR
jgi:threonylcarbamoyladenosine tRNA methylthiotransferase MtaB